MGIWMSRAEVEENLKSMSLGDHLEELRARLILMIVGTVVGFIIALFLGDWFLKLVAVPYESAMRMAGHEPQLQAIKVAETFVVYLKACMILGVIIVCPWLFYQVWSFVSAGLYRKEKKFVKIVWPISAGLFITGAFFFLFVVAPLALRFFVNFDMGIDFVNYRPTLTEYVNFILMLSLIFGLGFQMPIAVVFAERMGLVSLSALAASRKYVLLALFIIAAMATPPDVISQIALAVPLYALFEVSLIVCRVMEKKKLEAKSEA